MQTIHLDACEDPKDTLFRTVCDLRVKERSLERLSIQRLANCKHCQRILEGTKASVRAEEELRINTIMEMRVKAWLRLKDNARKERERQASRRERAPLTTRADHRLIDRHVFGI